MTARRLPTALAFLLAVTSPAVAQQNADRTPKLAGQRTVVGIVTDTLGNVIDSAQIFIADLQRRSYSGTNGTFRFDNIDLGRYEIGARRLGYLPQVRPVTVGKDGGAITFELLPIVRILAPVVTSSTRGGLSGVIGDTAYNIIKGADVWVIATSHRATSDSMGRFFIDIRPGKYMIQVSRAGYASRMISVSVPPDSGRRVVAWLAPASHGGSNMDHLKVLELNSRLDTLVPARSKLFTREDITRIGYEELLDMARAGAGSPVSASCPALIDGGPERIPLWGLSAADLEYVEVYLAKPPRPPSDVLHNRPGRIGPISKSSTMDCPVTVFAWLRK
jgi:hypothetical protein